MRSHAQGGIQTALPRIGRTLSQERSEAGRSAIFYCIPDAVQELADAEELFRICGGESRPPFGDTRISASRQQEIDHSGLLVLRSQVQRIITRLAMLAIYQGLLIEQRSRQIDLPG